MAEGVNLSQSDMDLVKEIREAADKLNKLIEKATVGHGLTVTPNVWWEKNSHKVFVMAARNF